LAGAKTIASLIARFGNQISLAVAKHAHFTVLYRTHLRGWLISKPPCSDATNDQHLITGLPGRGDNGTTIACKPGEKDSVKEKKRKEKRR
jgi:hypothetical protein